MTRTTPQAHLSRFPLLVLTLASLLLVLPTPVVHAATITVNDTGGGKGGGTCTLRDAIEAANTNAVPPGTNCTPGSGDDTIDLPAGVIITLNVVDNGAGVTANGLPVIASNITINGNNATIQRDSSGATPYFRIFYVSTTRNLTLNNVTIRNGRAGDGSASVTGGLGGGIANYGTLVVSNSTISGNRTGDGSSGGLGGGIASIGTLTITNSYIDSNATGIGSTSLGGSGGGIYNNGKMSISNSRVDGNTIGTGASSGGMGGGIYNYSNSTFSLSNTTITNNTAGSGITYGGAGGGIYNGSGIPANIADSTIRGNTTGTGGTGGGDGGGIYQGSSGTLTITGTTISGNTGGNGGSQGGSGAGIYAAGGVVNLTNSTLSGNNTGTPIGDGGGIHSDATLNVTSSTIANNTAVWAGGGIFANTGSATLKNAIVANNTASAGANCIGTITNSGNNLDSGTSCGWGSANGSMSNTDPLLGALADNGGPAQTLALQADSPALDGVTYGGSNGSPPTDERGAARPQGARHDIGAYEAVFITVNTNSGSTGGAYCTVRDAITAANKDTATGSCSAGLGPDIVVLPASATITLSDVDNGSQINTNGMPVITSTITIRGNNAIVQRSSADGTAAFRIFEVDTLGNLTLNNVTVRNGRAPNGTGPGMPGGFGGGISSFGTLKINYSTISGNRTGDGNNSWGGNGGGIFIGAGTANITTSTISGNSTGNGSAGNSGGSGAGVFAIGTLALTNCTITGNATGTPNNVGGGLVAEGSTIVTSSTIASNTASLSGGGVRNAGGGITMRNSIVANNTASTNQNCDNTITNNGNNLDSGDSCGWGSTNNSLSGTNPLLGPLGNYGGPTQTMPLGIGSPAIDSVLYNAPNSSPSTDQRGFARPYGIRHDIGAFEWYPSTYLPTIMKNTP